MQNGGRERCKECDGHCLVPFRDMEVVKEGSQDDDTRGGGKEVGGISPARTRKRVLSPNHSDVLHHSWKKQRLSPTISDAMPPTTADIIIYDSSVALSQTPVAIPFPPATCPRCSGSGIVALPVCHDADTPPRSEPSVSIPPLELSLSPYNPVYIDSTRGNNSDHEFSFSPSKFPRTIIRKQMKARHFLKFKTIS